MELTTAERLLHTTVKLERLKAGQRIGSGTGFFYRVALSDDQMAPLIITNKHVVAGCDQIVAVCHLAVPGTAEPSGAFIQLTINIGAAGVPSHPSPDVDLCVLPIAELMNQAIKASTPMLFISLDAAGSLNPKTGSISMPWKRWS